MIGEIKTFELDGVIFTFETKYKEQELKLFRKGKDIIESCLTYEQLDNSIKFVELIKKQSIGVYSALCYLIESRRIDIKNCLEKINDINVIYEKVNPKKENEES